MALACSLEGSNERRSASVFHGRAKMRGTACVPRRRWAQSKTHCRFPAVRLNSS